MAPYRTVKKLNVLGAGSTRPLAQLKESRPYRLQGLRAVVTQHGRSLVADLEDRTTKGEIEEFSSFLPSTFGRRFTDADLEEHNATVHDPLYMIITGRRGTTCILEFTHTPSTTTTTANTTTAPTTTATK